MNLREKKDIRILLYSIYGVACAVWIVIVSCSFTKSHLTLWPHGRQHTRLPCPSPPPGVCANACSLSQWCYLTISSSVTLFSFHPQSFPASGSFPMSRLRVSGGQSIGASASVIPMNIQGWFPLGLTGLISLQSPRDFQESSPESSPQRWPFIEGLWGMCFLLGSWQVQSQRQKNLSRITQIVKGRSGSFWA